VKIEILYSPDCPNYLRAVEHLQKALLEEHVSADVKHVQVLDAATAISMRFLGSPSIRINGLDVERPARSGEGLGLCCRTYPCVDGREGAPTVELIREAIRELASPEKKYRCVKE